MSRAAEQGYAQAQINLGDLYADGKGVSLDYVTACMWYDLGSTGDPRPAIIRMKNLSCLITPKQRMEAQYRANVWLSAHRNPEASHGEVGLPLKAPAHVPQLK
jgi:TPR repeat protein